MYNPQEGAQVSMAASSLIWTRRGFCGLAAMADRDRLTEIITAGGR